MGTRSRETRATHLLNGQSASMHVLPSGAGPGGPNELYHARFFLMACSHGTSKKLTVASRVNGQSCSRPFAGEPSNFYACDLHRRRENSVGFRPCPTSSAS